MTDQQMDNLQGLVDQMRVSSPDSQPHLDELAAAIKEKLNVDLGPEAYRALAGQLRQLSLQGGNNNSNNQQQQQQQDPHKPSSWTSHSPSAFHSRNENTINQQHNTMQSPNTHHHHHFQRGRSPARANNNVRSNSYQGTSTIRGSSPIRNFWGNGGSNNNNNAPPAAGNNNNKESIAPPNNNNTTGSKSPFKRIFRRSGSKTRSPQGQEEKKDQDRGDSVGTTTGMRDRSPGASPHRNRSSPPLNSQGDYYSEPPVKSFVPPPSPIRPPVSSRPCTPVNQIPSRCSSPFSARPGLQEDEDSESMSLSGRSPVRAFSSSSISGAPYVPNASSGISSLRPQTTGHPVHRQSRGADIDEDKPIPPRARSRSPMCRPSPSQDDGDLPPAPPRSFSRSPQGRSASYVEVKQGDEQIQMPDLSMPDFDPNAPGVSLFTPPPRDMPAPRRHGENPFSNSSIDDGATPLYHTNHEEGDKFVRLNGTTPAVVDCQFNLGSKNGSNNRGARVRRPRKADKASLSPQPETIFSPMEVDEIYEQDSVQQTPEVPQFHIGYNKRNPHLRRGRTNSRSADNSFSSVSECPVNSQEAREVESAHPTVDYSGLMAFISGKREEAKSFYVNNNYRGSIKAYTEAIKHLTETGGDIPGDVFAVLLSNRAAGLLMVGAYFAAVADCEVALQHVSPPRGSEPFSNDSGPLLKAKLHTRLARGFLKLGMHAEATNAFSDAVQTATEAMIYSQDHHSTSIYQQNQITLNQIVTDATLGQEDSKRLKESCDKLTTCMMYTMKNPTDRGKYAEALGHVNIALSIASGSTHLIESKLSLLTQMKRWREIAGYCERLGAINVALDLIFSDDLDSKNPFPGVPTAQVLKADFFGGARDEDISTKDIKLSSKAAAEAVLRLPPELMPIYVRALRLEERYPAADAATRALEEFVSKRRLLTDFPLAKFTWLPRERSKLDRTKQLREQGDDLFRVQDYDKAAATYAQCLQIDSESIADQIEGLNAGGRLHAVLHCNRAACLMALRRFHGAVEECTNALKIHSRYMKAILRRARCYTRLQQTAEAISEYKRWLDLVEDAKKSKHVPLTACLFDGPQDVKASEVAQTQKELDDVLSAKRRAEASAREEEERRRTRERDFVRENYGSSWRREGGASAQERRDRWYNQQNEPRRWDSFRNQGPRSHSNPRANSSSESNFRSSSHGRPRQEPSPSPRSDTSDHYGILKISQNASTEDIKKAYRKLALEYHPDRNKEDGAKENFLRIKAAHDVLIDPVQRRQYDSELRFQRRF